MKKVFLFLTCALCGLGAMANDDWEWDEETGEIAVGWNEWGDKKGGTQSVQWQAGSNGTLASAVLKATGNSAWAPQVGESFTVIMNGTADFSGTVQLWIVDQRCEAGYFSKMAMEPYEFTVVKGQPIDETAILLITNTTKATNTNGDCNVTDGDDVALTVPDLTWSIFPDVTEKTDTDPVTFNFPTFTVGYSAPKSLVNPMTLAYKGPADDGDGFKYQYVTDSKGTPTIGQYANVSLKGDAKDDISRLMFSIVEVCEAQGLYWNQLADDMSVVATEIAKDSKVDLQFSVPVTGELKTKEGGVAVFNAVFLANAANAAASVDIDNYELAVDFSATPKYAVPSAVEAIAAEEAIVNGVIYAESIVIYNAAGQVVANASESFEIATLPAGTYFALTEKGAFSFVK